MKFHTAPLLGLQALLHGAEASQASDYAKKCEDIASTLSSQLENTKVNVTQYIQAGSNITVASTHETCDAIDSEVDFDFCRIRMHTTTSDKSGITLETWLPSNWTGRFLSVGNGGLGGCIALSEMKYAAARGFAVVGANNGHDGNTGKFFYNNREVLEDFAYRSLHTGVVVGKEVTKAYYGKEHTKSYYLGCSTGGRQGFKEAQDFPDDFDGIVAGAPALAFNGLISWSGAFYTMTGPANSSTFLTRDDWALVIADVLKQCDGLDGHEDGIIEDPDLCQYRPEALICGANETTACLTGTQAQTVREVFSPIYGSNGTMVYPRMQPGADATDILWNGVLFEYSADWLKYVVYSDPSWDSAITVKDIDATVEADPFGIQTWKGNLSAVRDRGSKILHYHGLQDPIISSDISARYYNHVSRTMGLRSNELDEFYRYFRISGMAHCTGGTGAYNIGNEEGGYTGEEPEENILAAIVRWVEEGTAPEYVLGKAYTDDTKETVMFERKHCKYPLRNVYKGSGNANVTENWECV